jgi:hypothetical protein
LRDGDFAADFKHARHLLTRLNPLLSVFRHCRDIVRQ